MRHQVIFVDKASLQGRGRVIRPSYGDVHTGDVEPSRRRMEKMMNPTTSRPRRFAMVAHDNKKTELLSWADFNRLTLSKHELYATGTTGSMLEYELGMHVTRFLSGPVGGDQQIGAKIAEGLVDVLVFFWDPLEPQPHDPDVRALLRLAVVWNIPVATNVATADYLISSPLFGSDYLPQRPDHAPRDHDEVGAA
jgi:methylglyoxal synthase